MTSLRLLAPALAAAAALALPVIPTSAAAPVAGAAHAAKAKPKYQEYVALGDSWTADVVVLNSDGLPDATYAPIDCAQSHHNYPKIVAATIGVRTFRDASCGSATTDDFAHPQTGLPAGGTNPPQFDRLTKTTDLVTVGIGGNDAGIASAGIGCLNVLPVASPIPPDTIPLPPLPIPIIGSTIPLGGCKDRYTQGGKDQLTERINASEVKLVRAFNAIHRISPKARIIAVDYLSLVPNHACYPLVPATDEDMAYIHAKFLELNAMVKRAAKRGGAEFVNTYTPTLGHDLCRSATVRYGETFGPSVNDPAVGIPAHPNGAGARAQAAVVLQYLRTH
ncbi:SGNH/GDSL hydrolase family protein [Nocardioides sp.]|uniref:SGNH/GDSL hydrolase family protein n=1 Tax=Nocardioides sp. TaxID=35761 RepID=UPI0031FEBA25|nr:Lipase 2 precursor [Nocardioides sp.]